MATPSGVVATGGGLVGSNGGAVGKTMVAVGRGVWVARGAWVGRAVAIGGGAVGGTAVGSPILSRGTTACSATLTGCDAGTNVGDGAMAGLETTRAVGSERAVGDGGSVANVVTT
ncbi:MAG: hypothetical protein KIH69_018895 [Anaerolineae bacterium]|nr:hypothetical protein [Anaerolineae bacterium]